MTQVLTQIDGIGLDDDTLRGSNPGVLSGFKLKYLGQTSPAVATTTASVANQEIGYVASPATTGAGVAATVTVNNTLVTANSHIYLSFSKNGTTAPPTTWFTAVVTAVAAGTSFTITFTAGAALAASALNIEFRIVN